MRVKAVTLCFIITATSRVQIRSRSSPVPCFHQSRRRQLCRRSPAAPALRRLCQPFSNPNQRSGCDDDAQPRPEETGGAGRSIGAGRPARTTGMPDGHPRSAGHGVTHASLFRHGPRLRFPRRRAAQGTPAALNREGARRLRTQPPKPVSLSSHALAAGALGQSAEWCGRVRVGTRCALHARSRQPHRTGDRGGTGQRRRATRPRGSRGPARPAGRPRACAVPVCVRARARSALPPRADAARTETEQGCSFPCVQSPKQRTTDARGAEHVLHEKGGKPSLGRQGQAHSHTRTDGHTHNPQPKASSKAQHKCMHYCTSITNQPFRGFD